MAPEIEKLIRDKVDEFKAKGKKLQRGNAATCLIGSIGGYVEANKIFGTEITIALECGFEGFNIGKSSRTHFEYYELGRKIAEENGIK